MASAKGNGKDDATRACQAGQAALSVRLLKRISSATAAAGGNLVFSPLSIHVALALMSTAAAGDTLAEILRIAGAPSREEVTAFVRSTVVDRVLADQSGVGGPSISFTCGTWTDKQWPLRPTYVDAVVGTFKGKSWAVDFAKKLLGQQPWRRQGVRSIVSLAVHIYIYIVVHVFLFVCSFMCNIHLPLFARIRSTMVETSVPSLRSRAHG